MNDGTPADIQAKETDAEAGGAGTSPKPAAASGTPAAKLHVLGLAPLKERLGPKWGRLSDLVHKLFETSITRMQGPGDRVIKLDELSYALTFHKLSLGEANLACIAIAKEVCQMLFGNRIDEISVRSIVGLIVNLRSVDVRNIGTAIEAAVEECGTETVVTQSTSFESPEPVITFSGNASRAPAQTAGGAGGIHSLFGQLGLKIGFFPVWDLRKGTSNTLLLAPYIGNASKIVSTGFDAIRRVNEATIGDLEIFLLDALRMYIDRIKKAGKVCAVGVGVSYLTLTILRTRIRYITALQKVRMQPSTPLLLKIEQIPNGAPMHQLAELIAMMSLPNVHPLVEFADLSTMPEIDFALRAMGIGGACPQGLDYDGALHLSKKLARRAVEQKAFSFLNRLDTGERAAAASDAGIKFGMGTALGGNLYTGLEDVPDFPLRLAAKAG